MEIVRKSTPLRKLDIISLYRAINHYKFVDIVSYEDFLYGVFSTQLQCNIQKHIKLANWCIQPQFHEMPLRELFQYIKKTKSFCKIVSATNIMCSGQFVFPINEFVSSTQRNSKKRDKSKKQKVLCSLFYVTDLAHATLHYIGRNNTYRFKRLV